MDISKSCGSYAHETPMPAEESASAPLFDLLIPVRLPEKTEFHGASWRGPYAFNNEIGFQFGEHEASFHRSNRRHYIIIRLGLPHDAVLALVPEIRARVAQAAVELDLSIRPLAGPIETLRSGGRADLDCINLVVAGEMPSVIYDDNLYSIGADVSIFSQALAETPRPGDFEGALRIFGDVDFEATRESRFILLSTVLELLAVRQARDDGALAIIDTWSADATAKGRGDLVEALRTIKSESIGSSIARLVWDVARDAGCSEAEADEFVRNARKAYGKRGALLHSGKRVTIEDLTTIRTIVRLILTGKLTGTGFTQIGVRQWEVD
jgi:hypothetical protein